MDDGNLQILPNQFFAPFAIPGHQPQQQKLKINVDYPFSLCGEPYRPTPPEIKSYEEEG